MAILGIPFAVSSARRRVTPKNAAHIYREAESLLARGRWPEGDRLRLESLLSAIRRRDYGRANDLLRELGEGLARLRHGVLRVS